MSYLKHSNHSTFYGSKLHITLALSIKFIEW
jgi:hypothetical protein